ncbi:MULTISPECIES: hypothetical protein [unclassified Duganella]|uniref:hypothetical protein n=1 Tax=unclassified Duganella TaxID=2636909 RepID=UPI0006F26180|nr:MULTISPECIES: hypothetical protein [unclassified Duganella]KQV53695.1 hypothetical protein ASD07_03825 [Duganella sp. Root336D2]KRB83750.1 hypothetical protein ASE26_11355 [Duganella sp. Root198D2]
MYKKLLFPLAASAMLGGCASTPLVEPDRLAAPASITCIQLPQALTASDTAGMLKLVTETRLERGPYVSEKEDAQGTYFRAPQGGISIFQPGNPGAKRSHSDGGFFMPKDPSKMPSIYLYTSMEGVAPEVPAEGTGCANVGYTKDPVTHKLSVGLMATAGGLGGAAGRAVVKNSSLSYGQAAAGGAVAGALVAYLVNKDMGKITTLTVVKDQAVLGKLRELSVQAVALAVQENPAAPAAGAAPQ